MDDGGGFEEGEEGSGEEGDLLTGDEGSGTVAKLFDIGEGSGGGMPAAVLFKEQIGDGGAQVRILGGNGEERGKGGSGEEGGEQFATGGVVEEEPAEPGQHRDGVTVDFHRCAGFRAWSSFSRWMMQRRGGSAKIGCRSRGRRCRSARGDGTNDSRDFTIHGCIGRFATETLRFAARVQSTAPRPTRFPTWSGPGGASLRVTVLPFWYGRKSEDTHGEKG